ncbi:hypothetical protein Q0P46_14540, partial [Staphylococcus aureus]|nr:hypothetical protein [Staphylococcus aureus]
LNGSLMQNEHDLMLPSHLPPSANGLFTLDGKDYLPLSGRLYQVTFDKTLFKWRLKHPSKLGVDTPLLEHNGQGAWR